MASATDYAKCEGILEGEPVIKGIPVWAGVKNWRLCLSPREIIIHMVYLALAKVFEALSYCSNRKEGINAYAEASLDIPLTATIEDENEEIKELFKVTLWQVRAPPIFNAENSGLQFNQMLLAKNLL